MDSLITEIRAISKNKSQREDALELWIFDLTFNIQLLKLFVQLNETLVANGFGLEVTSEFNDPIDLRSEHVDSNFDLNCRIRILKPEVSAKYFFTETGFFEYLEESDLGDTTVVYLAFLSEPVKTLSVGFCPFATQVSDVTIIVKKPELIRYVKPLNEVAQALLPQNLTQWIYDEDANLPAFDDWINLTSKRIIVSLGSEFFCNGESLNIEFLGERRKSLIVEQMPTSLALLRNLCRASFWIYLDGSDIASRHQIFNYQFSLLINDSGVIDDGALEVAIDSALKNAKLAYRYHLITSSKELNKNLVDLNKSLLEHTSKIRQNTVDLIANLWKDFAVVFGVIVLNYLIKKPDIPPAFYSLLGVSALVYVVVSFTLSNFVNFWFYYSLKTNLVSIKPRVYSYLSDEDFNTIALRPLAGAQKRYLISFGVIAVMYVTMVISLIAIFL